MLSTALCATLTSGLMVSCNTNDGGTEIPNELVGKEYIAGKGPAADAEIKLIPVGYLPGAPGADSGKGVLVSGRTDGQGRFSFTNLAPGQYRLRVSTILPLYVPLIKEITVRSGVRDNPAPGPEAILCRHPHGHRPHRQTGTRRRAQTVLAPGRLCADEIVPHIQG